MPRLWALLFLILLTPHLFATPARLEEDIADFRSFENREDGSPGEREVFELVAQRLDELEIVYSRSPLDSSERGHSYSENLLAMIPGTHPGRIVLASPVDGGAFGTAFLLEMAALYELSPPKHDIVLAFLGAEKGNSPYHPYGSGEAAAEFETDTGILAVYLDGDDIPLSWQIRIGGDGKVSPVWLLSAVTKALSAKFILFGLRGTDIQVGRLGLQGDTRPLTPWLEAEIPVLMLSGSGKAEGSDRYRQITRLADAVGIIDRQFDTIPENFGSSFIFLRPLESFRPRIVGELPTVIGFLAISALIIVIILTRYRAVSLNLRRFVAHWWAWPLLFVMVFMFFFLATLFVEETLLLADFPQLWKYAPGTFVFFKLAVAAALSLNFILITRGLPLPRSPHYYSYTAITTSGIASLVFLALDITIAVYSIWTIVMLLLLTGTRNERWKIFFLLLSTIPYFMGLAVIIREPYEVLIQGILLNRIGGNLILTLILMPVIFAFTSLSYWGMHYHGIRRNVVTPTATLILTISAVITLIWILNLQPFGSENPQPVELIDRIDLNRGDRRLEVTSPAPIGNATLTLGTSSYPLENLGRTAEVRASMDHVPLKIEHSTRTFLGRRIVTVLIDGDGSPESLDINLTSSSSFTLHDADIPFEVAPGGTSVDLFVGRNPPFPMKLQFTVNADASITLSCVATWENPVFPPRMKRNDLFEQASRIVHLETLL